MRSIQFCTWVIFCWNLIVADVNAAELPEVNISYNIEVSLNPATRQLSGKETLKWTNPSSTETISKIPLHLYLNAFSSTSSTWMQSSPIQVKEMDELLNKYPSPWGYNELKSIKQGTAALKWKAIAPDDGNSNDQTLVEVELSSPLPPGETLELEIEFDARLPIPMARTGGRDVFFVVAQWFPKIAVYETKGMRGVSNDQFNAHQFFGKTEFYADYADYNVRIGVPKDWQVFATGRNDQATSKQATSNQATDDDNIRWHHFNQHAVPDFVWVSGTQLVASETSYQPQGTGGPVQIQVVVPKGTENQVSRWRKVVETSLDVLGSRIGEYPYSSITTIAPPSWASATQGMEYPTLILGGTGDPIWDNWPLDEIRVGEATVAHEFAHQYFAFLLASNEFEEAYMDEGFTEYWGDQIMIAMYGDKGGNGKLFERGIDVTASERMRLINTSSFERPVWSRPSFLAEHSGAFTQFYAMPALTMFTAARRFGQDTVDRVFSVYFHRWRYKHPRFEDYLAVAKEVAGDEFADFVAEAYTRKNLPDYQVVSMETNRWERPKGRLVTDRGVVDETIISDENKLDGLPLSALETDGKIVMRVLDPGYNHAGKLQTGSVEHFSMVTQEGEKEQSWESEEQVFEESTVRVEGPGWDHFPVEVEFRFSDGKVIRDHWDGRAGYRIYSFVRAAPLLEVHIDPDNINWLDPNPVNNALSRVADKNQSGDWSRWLGAFMQFFAEGLDQWL